MGSLSLEGVEDSSFGEGSSLSGEGGSLSLIGVVYHE